MDGFFHFFKVYLRRFWPEALAFVVVSVVASIWAAYGGAEFPDVPLAVMEALAWFGFTLRVMQSETTFLTQGGWRTRPIKSGTLALAQWAFYLGVLFPLLFVRAICLAIVLDWTLTDWFHHGALTSVFLLITLIFGAVGLFIAGKFARFQPWTKWAAVLLGAGCSSLLLALGFVSGSQPHGRSRLSNSSSGFNSTPLGLQAFIAATDSVIELAGAGGTEPPAQGLRLVARLPAKLGASTSHDGMNFKIIETQPSGGRFYLAWEIHGPSLKMKNWADGVLLAVRYANGTWGWPRGPSSEWRVVQLAGLPMMKLIQAGKILSPKIYPWITASWDELLNGAECYLFVPDRSVNLPLPSKLPDRPVSIGEKEMTVKLPLLPDNPTLLQLRMATLAAVDQIQIQAWGQSSNTASRLLDKAGSAAVPFVLECAPFGRNAWDDHLQRFLIKHATAEHVPALLKLLETDPRAAEVMIPKGWKNEALPLLRKHLENRLPLGYEGFQAMAELKDPSLAPHLAAQVLNGASNEFDSSKPPLLRDHPGIDWLALVKEGCRRSAMDDGEPNSYWLENSAPLGDRELFRKQVGAWLRNSNGPPSKGTMGAWIAKTTWDGESAAFPAWVRENFEKLRWDDALKRWVL